MFSISRFLNFLDIFFHTIVRDLKSYWILFKIVFNVLICERLNLTLPVVFDKILKKNRHKTAFIFEDKKWTFDDIDKYSNQLANYFHSSGHRKGDCVSLFISSRPENPIIWFSLSKIGVISALINEHLRSDSLIQAINASKSRTIIFDDDVAEAIEEIHDKIADDVKLIGLDLKFEPKFSFTSLSSELNKFPSSYLISDYKPGFFDIVCFVYTSGTTGLPKPAIIRCFRIFLGALAAKHTLKLKQKDIIYCSLPLYHSLAAAMIVGNTFINGNTVALRKKFSASKFWDDCRKYQCTVAVYIGEMTRYLLTQPPKSEDRDHKVRKMIGVGLRPNIWKPFVQRFGVKKVIEFFASTEGNSNLANMVGKEGACGYLPVMFPPFILKMLPFPKLIAVDEESGEPLRGSDGLCHLIEPGENGMLIAEIRDNLIGRFDGYLDKEGTSKKIINNVFRYGDAYFASYDVLSMDKYGYLYFADRLGDTFRWKGENVSTNQVESIIGAALNIVECVVYGVEIPGNDGRAGMVTVNSPTLDFARLYEILKVKLPKYAIPIFIRLKLDIKLTATFKFNKVVLKKEGFNVTILDDPVYFLDPMEKGYRKLDNETYEDIINGQIRF